MPEVEPVTNETLFFKEFVAAGCVENAFLAILQVLNIINGLTTSEVAVRCSGYNKGLAKLIKGVTNFKFDVSIVAVLS